MKDYQIVHKYEKLSESCKELGYDVKVDITCFTITKRTEWIYAGTLEECIGFMDAVKKNNWHLKSSSRITEARSQVNNILNKFDMAKLVKIHKMIKDKLGDNWANGIEDLANDIKECKDNLNKELDEIPQ